MIGKTDWWEMISEEGSYCGSHASLGKKSVELVEEESKKKYAGRNVKYVTNFVALIR